MYEILAGKLPLLHGLLTNQAVMDAATRAAVNGAIQGISRHVHQARQACQEMRDEISDLQTKVQVVQYAHEIITDHQGVGLILEQTRKERDALKGELALWKAAHPTPVLDDKAADTSVSHPSAFHSVQAHCLADEKGLADTGRDGDKAVVTPTGVAKRKLTNITDPTKNKVSKSDLDEDKKETTVEKTTI